ncbi:MAG: MBL fold metallo-hydrolase [Chitinophagales bacterium]|nr:MBL fold metallo-hydrolase [Bacteroidota bacterium]MCB9044202.1 MBL fold metallo-hydrolase [Chitinophagales bacterium]
MEIAFYGAAQQVTGSKHVITLKSGKRILLDCGLFQGKGSQVDGLNRHFGFNPKDIDLFILSHAHIDHSGLIPKLVKEGYEGKIWCTPATRDLCEFMLLDSAHIQESDIKYINLALKERGKPLIKPIYTIEDAKACMSSFYTIPYNTVKQIDEDVWVEFTDAGHILGSAVVNLRIKDGMHYHRIAFTGDLGRYTNRIIRTPQDFPQCDFLIAESTYGNRLHPHPPKPKEKLLEVVRSTCIEKGGKLIIPAFSVGRTQEIVSVLNDLEFEGQMPPIKVFVDSPMAIDATEVMREHSDCFNEDMQRFMQKDPDPFGFSRLTYVRSVDESKALNDIKEPCIIISASGMIEGGRIKHHLINSIENKKNTILIVGYCSKSSVGGQLVNGAEEVSLFGKPYKVRADVRKINAFSAHGDYEEMIRTISCQDKQIMKKIFLVHGDPEVMEDYRATLLQRDFHNIYIPDYKQHFQI